MNPYIQYMYSYPHKTAYRPLKGVFFQEYASLLSGGGHSLYFHIPFCQSKCGYCNLFSITGQGEEEMSRYLDAAERQCRQYREMLSDVKPDFSDVSVGGGTPLLLTERQLERMFHILETHFTYGKDKTTAIETAPNQTVREKLQILRQANVTRVSMGIQSFSDRELQALGRRHDAERAKKALDLLKAFAFPCVNVDFIYGIPEQTEKSLLASLKEAVSFSPDEIFLYPLYIKHGAWLKQKNAGNPAAAYRQYQEGSAFLKAEGYRQDSMRRFVRKERRDFSECGFGDSLAIGCGGRSYLGRLHFCTPYAVAGKECIRQVNRFLDTEDFSQITHGMLLSEEEMKRRYVIRHLLIRPGLDIRRYRENFGTKAEEDFPKLLDWMRQGYAEICKIGKRECLALTETGLGLSDYLGPQLISAQVWEKMQEWEGLYGRKDDIIPGQLKKL